MRNISLLAVIAVCLLALSSQAHADIYKCTDDAGNVAYLQLPCPVRPAAPVEVEPRDEAEELEEQADLDWDHTEPAPPRTSREPGEALAECKKRYRDQIDAVEAELFATDVAEQGEVFKTRLLALAQELRACG